MQYIIHAFTSELAVSLITNVPFYEPEFRPLLRSDKALHFIQIVLMASGKVIQPYYVLI